MDPSQIAFRYPQKYPNCDCVSCMRTGATPEKLRIYDNVPSPFARYKLVKIETYTGNVGVTNANIDNNPQTATATTASSDSNLSATQSHDTVDLTSSPLPELETASSGNAPMEITDSDNETTADKPHNPTDTSEAGHPKNELPATESESTQIDVEFPPISSNETSPSIASVTIAEKASQPESSMELHDLTEDDEKKSIADTSGEFNDNKIQDMDAADLTDDDTSSNAVTNVLPTIISHASTKIAQSGSKSGRHPPSRSREKKGANHPPSHRIIKYEREMTEDDFQKFSQEHSAHLAWNEPVQEQYWCKSLLKIVRSLTKTKAAHLFLGPVDWITLNIPDYPTIIKHPMDLRTVENKLANGEYQNPDDCISDVRLVFSNALIYNSAEHYVTKCAKELSIKFETALYQL